MRLVDWVRNTLGMWVHVGTTKAETNEKMTTGKGKQPKKKSLDKADHYLGPKTRSRDHVDSCARNGASAAASDGVREKDEGNNEQATEKPLLSLRMLIWLTRIVCALAWCSFCIASICLIMVSWEWKGRGKLAKGLSGCWKEGRTSCYPSIKAAIFPSSEIDNSYQITCVVAETAFARSEPFLKVTIPLLLYNPAIWSLIVCMMYFNYRFLSSLRDSLATAGAVKVILFHQTCA